MAETKKQKKSFNRSLYLFLIGLCTQCVSILQKPKKQISDSTEALCNYYITKFDIFNIHLDCDSQYFLLDSQSPSRIFENQTPLQDRPFYTLLVFLSSKILNVIGVPSGPIRYLGEDGIPQTYQLLNYGIFLIINIIIIAASLYFISRVLSSPNNIDSRYFKLVTLGALLLVTQNPITREFFWTPHTQLFNILIPCLLFYLVQEDFFMSKRNLTVLILSISVLLLMYPTFFIVLPIVFIKTQRSLGTLRASLVSLCLIPKLLWPFILNSMGGNYIDWPLTYHRRFIWIYDSFRADTLGADIKEKLSAFMHSLPTAWTLILLIFLAAWGYAVRSRDTQIYGASLQRTRDSLTVLIIYTLGIVLNGAYGARFTMGIVIMLGLIVLKEAATVSNPTRYWWIFCSAFVTLNCWSWFLN